MLAAFINIALGALLILAPSYLDYEDSIIANWDRISGPALIVFSTLSLWDIFDRLRVLCFLTGASIIVLPAILLGSSRQDDTAVGFHLILGFLILAMSLIPRDVRRRSRRSRRGLLLKTDEKDFF